MNRTIKFKVWDKYKNYFNSDYAINGTLVWGACERSVIQEKEHLVFLQFTGLLDKNGKEIYEGDIVKNGQGHIEPVEFVEHGFWCISPNGQHIMPHDREVIGNIYSNPELCPSTTNKQ